MGNKTRVYRGVSVYIKPGKNGGYAGEINFGHYRTYVRQQSSVLEMMEDAKKIIDANLTGVVNVEAAWFRMPLV
jgi:hypothetical protein